MGLSPAAWVIVALRAGVLSFVLLLGVVVRVGAQNPPLCPSCIPYAVSVSVIGDDQLGAPRNGSGLTALYRVQNIGTVVDDYDLTCTATGGVTCGPVEPTTSSLDPGELITVAVTFSTGTTLGTLRLTATGQEGHATNVAVYNVSYAPVITFVVPAASGGRAVVRLRLGIFRDLRRACVYHSPRNHDKVWLAARLQRFPGQHHVPRRLAHHQPFT